MNKKNTVRDAYFLEKATYFFKIEYAKRHALKYLKYDYQDAQQLYEQITIDIRLKNPCYSKFCFQIIIDSCLENLTDCIENFYQYHCNHSIFNSKNRKCYIIDSRNIESFKKYINYRRTFRSYYNIDDVDFFSKTNITDTLVKWKKFKLDKEKKAKTEPDNYNTSNKMQRIDGLFIFPSILTENLHYPFLLRDITPNGAQDGVTIFIDIKNHKLTFEKAHDELTEILLNHLDYIDLNKLETNSKLSTTKLSTFQKQNIRYLKKLIEKLKKGPLSIFQGKSIDWRLEGLWHWDNIQINNVTIENSLEDLSNLLISNGIETDDLKENSKAYSKTVKEIKNIADR